LSGGKAVRREDGKVPLVRVMPEGLEPIHGLDDGPLHELYLWREPYAQAWASRLERLRQHLENPEDHAS
jgi:hypothetical protein